MEGGLIYSAQGFEEKVIESVEDCFAQAQRAAEIRDWKAFRRFMNEHAQLCNQWEALIS